MHSLLNNLYTIGNIKNLPFLKNLNFEDLSLLVEIPCRPDRFWCNLMKMTA